MSETPREDFDELGLALQSGFDKRVEVLADLRRSVELLKARGHEIDNATELEIAAKDLQQIKLNCLANWPWSSQELPPVNRDMAVASMAALARGEQGEPIEDLIARLGGKLTSE